MEKVSEIIHESIFEIKKDISIVLHYFSITWHPTIQPFIAFIQDNFSTYLHSYKKSKFRSRAHQLLLAASKSEQKLLVSAAVFTILALIFTCIFFSRNATPKKKPIEITSNKRQVGFTESSVAPTTPIHTHNDDDDDDITYLSPKKTPTKHTGLSDAEETAFALITGGTVLIKHGRMGTRHIRFVTISEDLTHICWRPIGALDKTNALPLNSFKTITVGGQERTLRCAESCLLSLVGKTDKERTLHFEFASFPSYEENARSASDWADSLGLCAKAAKQIVKAKSPRSPASPMTPSTPIRPTSPGRRSKSPGSSARKVVQRLP